MVALTNKLITIEKTLLNFLSLVLEMSLALIKSMGNIHPCLVSFSSKFSLGLKYVYYKKSYCNASSGLGLGRKKFGWINQLFMKTAILTTCHVGCQQRRGVNSACHMRVVPCRLRAMGNKQFMTSRKRLEKLRPVIRGSTVTVAVGKTFLNR